MDLSYLAFWLHICGVPEAKTIAAFGKLFQTLINSYWPLISNLAESYTFQTPYVQVQFNIPSRLVDPEAAGYSRPMAATEMAAILPDLEIILYNLGFKPATF